MLQRKNTYLQEVQKTYVSLAKIDEALSAFNLLSSLIDQVKLFLREVEKKDKALASACVTLFATKVSFSAVQEDLENLCHKNVSLAQKVYESSIFGLKTVSDSLENALLQVEHFYSPLHVSRERVWSNQIFVDGKVVSLRNQI